MHSQEANPDSDDILARIRRIHWCGIYTRQSRGPKDEYDSHPAKSPADQDFADSSVRRFAATVSRSTPFRSASSRRLR